MDDGQYLCCRNYCHIYTGGYLAAYVEAIALTASIAYAGAITAVQRGVCCDLAQLATLIACVSQTFCVGVLSIALRFDNVRLYALSLATIFLRIVGFFALTIAYTMQLLIHVLTPFPVPLSADVVLHFVACLFALATLIACFYWVGQCYGNAVKIDLEADSIVVRSMASKNSTENCTERYTIVDEADEPHADDDHNFCSNNVNNATVLLNGSVNGMTLNGTSNGTILNGINQKIYGRKAYDTVVEQSVLKTTTNAAAIIASSPIVTGGALDPIVIAALEPNIMISVVTPSSIFGTVRPYCSKLSPRRHQPEERSCPQLLSRDLRSQPPSSNDVG